MSTEAELNSPDNSAQYETAPRASGSAVPYFLCLAVLFAMAYGGWTWWKVWKFEQARGQAIPDGVIGPPVKDFELTERSGKPFRSTDMRGRVWVASYFFTSCIGQCVRLNSNIQLMNNEPDLKDVTWVSISCDPDTDTTQALRTCADRYQADPKRWLFCRGDLDYTKRVAAGMKVDLNLRGHKDYLLVFDKNGKMRGALDGTSAVECNLAHDLLRKLLSEKPAHDLAARGAAKEKSS
jgi:cytochrome oxidase Cu insertion factor (SCO1/SenC/PrrC family)